MKKEEAIAIAKRYLNDKGYDTSGQNPNAFLLTKDSYERDGGRFLRLKQTRPDAWKYILETHRDCWSVSFDLHLGNSTPRSSLWM
jgi:hypothetical protein